MKVLELFGGIGACSKALERLGIDFEIVDYVEIDKYAVKSFNAIHGTNFEPQDVCTWDKDMEVDLIMHGSPCQDFSLSGKQLGGDKGSGTRSSLMYETIRIVKKLKPKYVIWENVKNILSKKHIHNFNTYIDEMCKGGYTSYYQVLNAKDYGIPQNRERVFTISIRNDLDVGYYFPPKQELKLKLKDLLESEVDEKYYLSNKMIRYISAPGTANFRNHDCKINLEIARPLTTDPNKRAGTTNYFGDTLPDNYDLKETCLIKNQGKEISKLTDIGNTLMARDYKGFGNQEMNAVIETKLRIRRITPLEAFRLMGFDDIDYLKASKVNSNTQLYKQAGNSIVVNVMEAILRNLLLEDKIKGTRVQTNIYDFIKEE